jgi:hypothetical protein
MYKFSLVVIVNGLPGCHICQRRDGDFTRDKMFVLHMKT